MFALVSGLAEEREELLLARTVANTNDKAAIDRRLSVVEGQIIDLIKVEDMKLIEDAKNDEHVVVDAFTKIIDNVQSRRDTRDTLIQDVEIMEDVGWK